MSTAPAASASLSDWLDYISAVNPREIELGLERVGQVWQQLGAGRPGQTVITVAGTNGKGTCVAALEDLLARGGYRVACYTSPHLFQFNERVRIDGKPVADDQLCSVFATIDQARDGILLSYFEFATLAALLLFREADVDVAVLEVGLGGRLDAVNIIDADVAVITSISLDHTDWLGSDLEVIASEKAGIMRPDKPVVSADRNPPAALAAIARELGAPLYAQGDQFSISTNKHSASWQFRGVDARGETCVIDAIPESSLRADNLAAAVQALLLADRLDRSCVPGLADLQVAGRLQSCRDLASGRRLLLDVAHNPAAITNLVAWLQRFRAENPASKIAVVMAVMADKDVETMTASLQTGVDIWYIAQVDQARCMPAHEVAQIVARQGDQQIGSYSAVKPALKAALADTTEQDLVVVTGSFFTVAELKGLTGPL